MIACERGDVVLVGFVFSDESGKKMRPAVVVSTRAYHRARQELVIAAITSRLDRNLYGDHPLSDWRSAGLICPSLVAAIYRTVKQTMVERKLGAVTRRDLGGIDLALRRALGIPA